MGHSLLLWLVPLLLPRLDILHSHLWSVDISTDAVDYPKHNFKTTAMKDIYAMDAKMVPNERAVLSHAFFLDIGSNFSAVPQ